MADYVLLSLGFAAPLVVALGVVSANFIRASLQRSREEAYRREALLRRLIAEVRTVDFGDGRSGAR